MFFNTSIRTRFAFEKANSSSSDLLLKEFKTVRYFNIYYQRAGHIRNRANKLVFYAG